jgi:broad specificity phosphatase PhoE
VTVLLVRHAVAKARHRWEDDDDLRPLTTRGREQAQRLVQQVGAYPMARVLSSPSVRCIETVAPLAEALGVGVDVETVLAEGNGRRAVKLVRDLLAEKVNVALCSHGDVIPEVLDALGWRADRCAKGSTWVLDGKRATYLPPP